VTEPTAKTVLKGSGQAEDASGALARLQTLEAHYRAQRDARAVFAGAYLVITSAMHDALRERRFLDNPWVEEYLTTFANLYLQATAQYENDLVQGSGEAPPAWALAFQTCQVKGVSPLAHLLLGVNAHVNRDLSLALVHVGIHTRQLERYEDHVRVNEVLNAAVNDLQAKVTEQAPALAHLDALFGNWDERIACRVVSWARDTAWKNAVVLHGAQGAAFEHRLDRVDRRALQYALMIRRESRFFGARAAPGTTFE
jgi:hypothetical protein